MAINAKLFEARENASPGTPYIGEKKATATANRNARHDRPISTLDRVDMQFPPYVLGMRHGTATGLNFD
jgi:hypothetical protein